MDHRRNGRRRRQSHYGVQLLDDLHNHFPDILYNPSRFESVADLLAYISEGARAIERPYDAGLREYIDDTSTIFEINQPISIVRSTEIGLERIRHLFTIFNQADLHLQQQQVQALSRPTTEEIQRSTSIVTIECGPEDMCSICHEAYIRQQQVRRLNRCGHYFHELCIDVWLDDHVTCPICRCDIRGDEEDDGDSSLG